jgi:hypothetical protein
MAQRELPGGLTLSSPELSEADLALAEVLMDLVREGRAAPDGQVRVSYEELAQRLRAKGIDPDTGAWLS